MPPRERAEPLPHSREAEESYLGSILILNEIKVKVNIKDFYFEDNKKIYQAMRKLDKNWRKIDILTVGEQLESDWLLESIGWNMKLIELTNVFFYVDNQDEYARIIKEKATKRELMWIGYELARSAEDLNWEQLLEKLSEARNKIDKCGSSIVDETGGGLEDLLTDYLDFAGENNAKEGKAIGYKSGFKLIDQYCDGIQPWTVTRISAYTNVGKTRFAMQILANLLKQGVKCSWFSTEVIRKYFITNLISAYSHLSYNALKYWDWDVLRSIPMDEIKELPLDKFYDDKFKLEEITFLAKKHNPQVLFVDFAQNIDCGYLSDEYTNMTMYAREIQKFAIQNKIAVVDLSQISNASAKEQTSSFMGMKGSGALAASADVVINLSKAELQPPERLVSLNAVIQKNKYWPKDVCHNLIVDFDTSTFTEFEL